MTSLERVLATAAHTCPDVVPVGPFAGFYAARLTGVPLGRYVTDGAVIADAQMALQQATGQDIVLTAADTYYMAEAFGLSVVHYPDALPTAQGVVLEDLADVGRLKVPDPRRDGRMPVYLEALRLLVRRLGDRVAVRGTGTGPFSIAAYLYGDQRFLLKLAEIDAGMADPCEEELLHRLLHLASESSGAFLRAQLEEGEHLAYLGDSLASSDMISPAMYRRYALPYHRMVFDEVRPLCRERGAFTLLHICGDNTQILEDLVSTGADILEIDQKMDLSLCKTRVGERVCLIGNLNPTEIILQGDAEDVRRESGRCIEAAGPDGGFILGTGCFVPYHSPLGNLQAMVQTGHEHQYDADGNPQREGDTS